MIAVGMALDFTDSTSELISIGITIENLHDLSLFHSL